MKKLIVIAVATPLPALAHPGIHHHPHGVEGIWLGFAALAVGVAAAVILRNRG
jgi:hypothetical protein